MEDKVWRHIYSFITTVMFFVIFTGAYYAGANNFWWMGAIFLPIAYLGVFNFLVPD